MAKILIIEGDTSPPGLRDRFWQKGDWLKVVSTSGRVPKFISF